ncbi:DNA (cytosine-5-)-methyltransferase [Sphingomonas sp. LY54]|uniref:DNA (cytosine-5-)-methyltransferase n=1 Tax=Sphingomonas sp. LY54 TaxID=3095343 RepID=UPI002D7A3BDD|nr:DNA (cytosine-5-)-methyltransferase [Sphingomonas sp. LY54]WRP29420.1 DNA (cytosine-5-)-methyltransferase [Sphingomonas sp. LY54]
MTSQPRTEFTKLRQKAGLSLDEAAILAQVSERQVRRYEDVGESGCDPSPLVLDVMRRAAAIWTRPEQEPAFTFIDLFAGIGGLRTPFQEIGGKCIFTAEWDRFSRQTYSANFHDDPFEHEFAEDVRPYAKDPSRVPAHDVLLAGFPCQPFSIAGVSKKNALGRPHGFLCDTQGTLFYDLANILAHHRPAAFLLENVKNLESHDGGRTFATIMHVLEEELGYHVQYRVISSHPWVPQRRERIFIVGFRDRTSFDFDTLEVPEGRQPVLGDILEGSPPEKYTLTQHLWTYLQNYKAKHQKAGNGFGYSVFGPNDVTRTLSARYYKDGSEVLVLQPGGRPRRLTPRECARLMGFDEPQGSSFRIPVSDTQAYRQFGNAVVVPVVRAVARLMSPHLAAEAAPTVEETEPPRELIAVRG